MGDCAFPLLPLPHADLHHNHLPRALAIGTLVEDRDSNAKPDRKPPAGILGCSAERRAQAGGCSLSTERLGCCEETFGVSPV